MKRPASGKLYQRATKVSPGGVHSPVRAFTHTNDTPVFVESAEGAYIRDVDGNTYVDFCMAFGPLILGHQNPAVAAAAQQALDDGWSYGTAEGYSLQLAEFIIEHIPAIEQIRFVNSGTEAVMTAIRLARAVTGRDTILKFAGCYHGHTDAMLIEAGSGLSGRAISAGIPDSTLAETVVIPLDDSERLEAAFRTHGGTIAAAIIEPLPANFGLLPQRKEFLQLLEQLCKSNGALLIFDEVISGFRTDFGGYTEHTGLHPDIRTWGKIIGAGFPVGAIGADADLMQRLAPAGDVYQAGTLSANPLAMRAGLAALACLTDGSVYEQLERLGQRLEAGIGSIAELGITRVGSIFWLGSAELRAGPARDTNRWENAKHPDFAGLFAHLLDQGIYIAPSPYEVCFLAAAHSNNDIDRLLAALSSYQ